MGFSDVAWGVNEILDKLAETIGDKNSPSGIETIFGYFKRGFVKSVQTIKITSEEATVDEEGVSEKVYLATISPTNMSKTLVIASDYNESNIPYEDATKIKRLNCSAFQKSSDKIAVITNYRSGRDQTPYIKNVVLHVIEFY